jgi:ParB family chromosome partitioning protein
MSGRKALGRGLAAIIPQAATPEAERQTIQEIAVTSIVPNPRQPRREFAEEQLRELAESLREHGVLEPVIVRPQGSVFELVVGERRWRAAQIAGLARIPALVRVLDDKETVELALVENLQREDLNPIEEAEAFRRLSEDFGLTQEQIAERVGKRRSTVANRMRLLELESGLQDYVRSGQLSAGHARALLAVESGKERSDLARRAMNEGLSVRQVEQLVGRSPRGTRKRQVPAKREERNDLSALEEELQQVLGTRVRIVGQGKRGRIEIEFYSDEDVTRIYELIVGR